MVCSGLLTRAMQLCCFVCLLYRHNPIYFYYVLIVRVYASLSISGSVKNSHEEIAKLEHLGPVVDSVIKISDDLDTIERLQRHMRVRERVQRDSTFFVQDGCLVFLSHFVRCVFLAIEDTATRVQWVHVIESFMLVMLAMFQVSYIRAWFTNTTAARV